MLRSEPWLESQAGFDMLQLKLFSLNIILLFIPKFSAIYVIAINPKMSLVMRKPAFYIWENKDADQLRGNREADQRLCFRYIDSTIPLLSKYKISSL